VPEGSKKSRMKGYSEQDEEHLKLRLPNIEEAEYLIQHLYEAGVMLSNGMGATPLTWQEIDAWIRVTQRVVPIWERSLIRELSEAYVSEYNQAADKSRPAPYVEESTETKREIIASGWKGFAKSFNAARKKNAE
jgi:hypothetical protein